MSRLVPFALILALFGSLSSITAHASDDEGTVQAKLAYMDVLAGNSDSAFKRIPLAHANAVSGASIHPTLSFARQARLYGQNELSVKALEQYTRQLPSKELANQHWLEFGEYFLDVNSIPFATHCLNRVTPPVNEKQGAQYARLSSEVLLNNKDTEKVELIFKNQWRGQHPAKPYTRFRLASAYLNKGEFALADKAINKLARDFPRKTKKGEVNALRESANLRIGFAHLNSGNLDTAKKYFAKIPQDSIHSPRAKLGLTWAEFGKGDYQAALSPLEYLIESQPNYNKERQEAYNLLPIISSQQGDYTKAASLYEQSQQFYTQEVNALKRSSISVYSGRIINKLTTELKDSPDDHFNMELIPGILNKELYAYLFNLLEKDTSKAMFNTYYHQVKLREELNQWHQSGRLNTDSHQRLNQLMQDTIFEQKDRLVRLLASEIEKNIARLERLAAHSKLSIKNMRERAEQVKSSQ